MENAAVMKETIKPLNSSPVKIYAWLIGLFFACLCISFVIIYNGSPQVQQNGFGYILLEFAVFILALFVISIITTIAYKPWFIKNWYINAFVFVCTGFILGTILYSLIVNGGIG
jgi:cell division protein FtsW (lipid II flippase)